MLKVELSLTVKTDDVTSSRRDVEFCAWVFSFGSGANGLTEAYALSHLHFLCERLLSSKFIAKNISFNLPKQPKFIKLTKFFTVLFGSGFISRQLL